VTNTSARDGDEVVMLFVKPPEGLLSTTRERPWKELKSFARVHVPVGTKVTANLPVRMRDLRRWEGGVDGHWVMDKGYYTLIVAKDAEDAETTMNQTTIRVDGN
jgi:beta-glucosidase